MADDQVHVVAVIGAGPAGLFAARALANASSRVLLLNRDIKPGGLAEYGIFLDKYKMKGGLRRQFHKILSDPRITYLGHVPVGPDGPLTVEQLLRRGFDALVFAHGAQGTKYLGVEGERLPGVYHAKDLVYHYNRLPPFAEREFPMGRRVAIVGVGNVMVDIANYCAHYCDCDEIIAIARRGPFEKAYEDKEFEDVEDAFDRELYRQELERLRPRLEAVAQNPDELIKALATRPEPAEPTRARLRFRFLASPKRVVAENGRVIGLDVEETRLERKGDRINAAGTGEISRSPATPWCSRWATGWTSASASPTRTASTSPRPMPRRIRARPTRSGIPRATAGCPASSWWAGRAGPAMVWWGAPGSTPRRASNVWWNTSRASPSIPPPTPMG